ncbi:MAG TPA: nitroreductase [Candidatus Limnocylindria bacterium]|nr:nitroreductase [Candidatus Limnocylindria bacterium]
MSNGLTSDEVVTVVSAAVLAPSVLNTQPWRFRARDDVIEVWADADRGLTRLDPQGRELLISCGAALFNLRLSIAVLGRATVTRILPDPDQPTLVAQVRVGGPSRATARERRLHEVIPTRRASRHPFERADIPPDVLTAIQEAAHVEGARLERPPTWHGSALGGLVRDAERHQRDDPAVAADVRAWTGDQAPPGAGIPSDRLGPKSTDPTALVRDFSMGAHVDGRESADFTVEGVFLVLLTDHDAGEDRVRAGQALERAWLEATTEGVSTTLLSQPTEVPALRPWLRDPTTAWGVPQLLLRLGYGPVPAPTDRRDLSEVLDLA